MGCGKGIRAPKTTGGEGPPSGPGPTTYQQVRSGPGVQWGTARAWSPRKRIKETAAWGRSLPNAQVRTYGRSGGTKRSRPSQCMETQDSDGRTTVSVVNGPCAVCPRTFGRANALRPTDDMEGKHASWSVVEGASSGHAGHERTAPSPGGRKPRWSCCRFVEYQGSRPSAVMQAQFFNKCSTGSDVAKS